MSKKLIKKNCEEIIIPTHVGSECIYTPVVRFYHKNRGMSIGKTPAANLNVRFIVNTKKRRIEFGIERDNIVLKVNDILPHIYKNSILVIYYDTVTFEFIFIFYTPNLRDPEYDYRKQLDDLYDRLPEQVSSIEIINFDYK